MTSGKPGQTAEQSQLESKLTSDQKSGIDQGLKRIEHLLDFIIDMRAQGASEDVVITTMGSVAMAIFDLLKNPEGTVERTKYVLMMNYRKQMVREMLAPQNS